jgi:dTDP-glucose 4,6-dehydratase
MSILVTGGAGFIGANFVLDWLALSDERVVNLDRLTYAGNRNSLSSLDTDARHVFVTGGIEDEGLVSALLRKHSIRAVVNFAAESHVDRSIHGPMAFVETNVSGTVRLLEAVHRYWRQLDAARKRRFRFLQVSTDEVYGTLDADDPPFGEATSYRPNSPYAASKAASDHFARAYRETYGLPVLITNCSNNYGPYHFPEKLIPLIVHNALSLKTLPVYGDGGQIRDWLYVRDHCSALRAVLERGVPGSTYNIGGGNERTNIAVVQAICALLDELRPRPDGKPYADLIAFVKDRPGHDRRYAVDSAKIRRELGWRPEETFESGLRKTIRWYLDNGVWVAQATSGAYRDWVAKQYA